MKADLLNLVALQKLDLDIYSKRCEKDALPKNLETLRKQEQALSKKVDEVKTRLRAAESKKKDKEIEVQSTEQHIQKCDGQLNQIKKNDEYKAMLVQIDDMREKKDKLEEDILKIMDEIETIQKDLAVEQEQLNKDKAVLQEKEAEVQKVMDGVQQQLDELLSQRKMYTEKISKEILRIYEHILAKRQDAALASVGEDGVCSACHMILLEDIIDKARGGNVLVTCDTCSRILYHHQLLDSLASHPAEE